MADYPPEFANKKSTEFVEFSAKVLLSVRFTFFGVMHHRCSSSFPVRSFPTSLIKIYFHLESSNNLSKIYLFIFIYYNR